MMLGVGSLLVLVAVWSFAAERLRVDSCLDAGGSYDYELGRCDHERSHVVVAYTNRHPIVLALAIVGGVLVVTGLTGGSKVKLTRQ